MSIRTLIVSASIAAMSVVGVATLTPQTVSAASCSDPKSCLEEGVKGAGGDTKKDDIGPLVKNVVNIMLFILGAAAVIMIVIGGIKYTVSGGDSSAVKSAKDTILYSVVGVVVALLAYAIVNFVIGNVIV
jgi:hypothetical protein